MEATFSLGVGVQSFGRDGLAAVLADSTFISNSGFFTEQSAQGFVAIKIRNVLSSVSVVSDCGFVGHSWSPYFCLGLSLARIWGKEKPGEEKFLSPSGF